MVAIKPNQPSVCNKKAVWTDMCKIVSTKPSSEQIEKADKRSHKFSKVFKK